MDSGTKSSSGKLRLRFRDRDNGSIDELGLYGFVEELMALRIKILGNYNSINQNSDLITFQKITFH